jgi:hypothetical protein
MSGASNTWISRKAKYIIQNISPRYIVIQWSFIPRRELDDISKPDDERILHYESEKIKELSPLKYYFNNVDNFISCFSNVEYFKSSTSIIHTFVPSFNIDSSLKIGDIYKIFWDYIKNKIDVSNSLIVHDNKQLDYSRDGYHYDLETSKNYVDNIIELLS